MIERGQPLDGEKEIVPIGGLAVDFVGVIKDQERRIPDIKALKHKGNCKKHSSDKEQGLGGAKG